MTPESTVQYAPDTLLLRRVIRLIHAFWLPLGVATVALLLLASYFLHIRLLHFLPLAAIFAVFAVGGAFLSAEATGEKWRFASPLRHDAADSTNNVSHSTAQVTTLHLDLGHFCRSRKASDTDASSVLLRRTYQAVSAAISERDGTVSSFEDGQLKAYWLDTENSTKAPTAACRVAHEVVSILDDLVSTTSVSKNCRTRIGLYTSMAEVEHYQVGRRRKLAVLGDQFRKSQKCATINDRYGTRVVVDERTQRLCEDVIVSRPIVPAKRDPNGIEVAPHLYFELMGLKGEWNEVLLEEIASLTRQGLVAYASGNLLQAKVVFTRILRRDAHDEPARHLYRLCQARDRRHVESVTLSLSSS